MSDLISQKNELLEAVKEPERRKRQPGNYALTAAIVFSNLVFCLLDVISGITVYWMTRFLLYGILTFLAGFVPLLLHEFLFVRAYASETQKKIAVTGAVTALFSIVIIGILAGYVNIVGLTVDVRNAEIATVVALVLIAAFHAVLTTVYFYVDAGIKAQQITAQAVARAIQQGEVVKAGAYILELTQRSVEKRNAIGKQYNREALFEIMRQMGYIDANHDGIPDALQKDKFPVRQFNADTQPVRQHNNNGQHAEVDDPNPSGRQ